jgi:DNA-binding transcriptional regulator YiaG
MSTPLRTLTHSLCALECLRTLTNSGNVVPMNIAEYRAVILAAEHVVSAAGPDALKNVREAQGRSVQQWAADLEVTRQAVYLWERGARRPRGVAALAYTDALAGLRST